MIRAWESEPGCHRIGRSSSKEQPLDEGLVGRTKGCSSCPVLRLIQREPVERGGIGIQNEDANVGIGRLMQNFYQ